MNSNEKEIIRMIMERLEHGEPFVGGLFNILHTHTQKKLNEMANGQFSFGTFTDTGKWKIIEACKEMLK